jgi:hypothetical protein
MRRCRLGAARRAVATFHVRISLHGHKHLASEKFGRSRDRYEKLAKRNAWVERVEEYCRQVMHADAESFEAERKAASQRRMQRELQR